MAPLKSFPSMLTVKQARRSRSVVQQCRVCSLAVSPRNRMRHEKSCAARKRNWPATWLEWKLDMMGKPADDPRRPSTEQLNAEGWKL